jgi:23S rRNA pseudouridine1911/1915/1917 synthase
MASRFGISGDTTSALRLDLVLTHPPFSLSRREAKRRLAAGDVVVDGLPVAIASREVPGGAHVTLLAPDADLTLLHLDRALVVVDKPAALPTQPSPGSSNPSVLEVLASKLKRTGEKPDLFIVHRLDTNTTGVVTLARTKRAAEEISRTIAGHAEKLYLAICEGRLDTPVTLDAPIARVSGNQFGVARGGKSATSRVRPICVGKTVSLVEVRIETGRTHQIRVHLASIGHPVVGDRRYGSHATRELTARPMLHARSLALPGIGTFEASVPRDFLEACANLDLAIGGDRSLHLRP